MRQIEAKIHNLVTFLDTWFQTMDILDLNFWLPELLDLNFWLPELNLRHLNELNRATDSTWGPPHNTKPSLLVNNCLTCSDVPTSKWDMMGEIKYCTRKCQWNKKVNDKRTAKDKKNKLSKQKATTRQLCKTDRYMDGGKIVLAAPITMHWLARSTHSTAADWPPWCSAWPHVWPT